MKADITRVLAGQQATAVVPRVAATAPAAAAVDTPTRVVPPIPPAAWPWRPTGLRRGGAEASHRAGRAGEPARARPGRRGGVRDLPRSTTRPSATVAVPDVLTYTESQARTQLDRAPASSCGSSTTTATRPPRARSSRRTRPARAEAPRAARSRSPSTTARRPPRSPTAWSARTWTTSRRTCSDAGFTNVDQDRGHDRGPGRQGERGAQRLARGEGTTAAARRPGHRDLRDGQVRRSPTSTGCPRRGRGGARGRRLHQGRRSPSRRAARPPGRWSRRAPKAGTRRRRSTADQADGRQADAHADAAPDTTDRASPRPAVARAPRPSRARRR